MGMAVCFAAVGPDTLARLRAAPDDIKHYLHPDDGEGPPHETDVDKAWHGIHYLLTGTAREGREPFSWAIMGAEDIGPDLGMGPARLLTPEQVIRLAAALDSLTTDELSARFDPQAMQDKGIYPEGIWLRDRDDALQYLLENFALMADFYREAAARGDGVLLWTC
ncbi:MAG TPA: YfbM family protein [Ideonella sp.]|uniref:YfbM family protein n=1 Tax=Ideonella sp. TaxID=1929293 RepID=UPI002E36242A|nr:YfbM family protein [Ideonella sp.]HEX5685175.1 YfbM family protein [Ideonella sp.]